MQCGDVPLAEEFPHCRQRGFFCYNGDPNPRIQESERIINNSLCSDVTPAVSRTSHQSVLLVLPLNIAITQHLEVVVADDVSMEFGELFSPVQ